MIAPTATAPAVITNLQAQERQLSATGAKLDLFECLAVARGAKRRAARGHERIAAGAVGLPQGIPARSS